MKTKLMIAMLLMSTIANADPVHLDYFNRVMANETPEVIRYIGVNKPIVPYAQREQYFPPTYFRPDPWLQTADDVTNSWVPAWKYCYANTKSKYEYLGCMWSKGQNIVE